ncbi:MAG: aminomethyl-transferring glycine dehydrogenase [Opitutus sp.]|nr:aminomethyl-transferring glycine dehydrogenase [Opitutus sp.]MCS6246166.1 aminomethyl-transferring glycine dehydrogenase [Opitutus sp.]MCS6272989.1 aminomethyl-transferring glycine dehydrogenase [Opitutus sp.]MCS6278505.1 aminomethyl-transferring glycine dehydrogenase [Opitutus sp.]MCS6300093.1 aminomethyl-transferring glycine dehydrogenase [Opitutus sp.]
MPASAAASSASTLSELLAPTDSFARRHNGPDAAEQASMLKELGEPSLDALVDATVPPHIRRDAMDLPAALGEAAALAELRSLAVQNHIYRSHIGMGYYNTHTPGVIQRTILENPGWYTAYTPYQAEIAQGRLEALLNYQTLVTDLTGMEIANASMLDEGTAAAEAMMMCHRLKEGDTAAHRAFFVSEKCHPQTIDIVKTRAIPLGIEVLVGDHRSFAPTAGTFGVLVQYPDTTGSIHNFEAFFAAAHAVGAFTIVATDLLALTLLRAPGEFGADVAVGSAQRFGVPMGFGGPHAAFLATKDSFKRQMPGRLVGVSKDANGDPAMRLALGTREQHIRRDKATSNICTAQVLLAVMASMYAVYHGPDGLKKIARRVQALTELLAAGLRAAGATVNAEPVFDTLTVGNIYAAKINADALAHKINLRQIDASSLGISLDETTTLEQVESLIALFGTTRAPHASDVERVGFDAPHARTTPFLTAPVFNRYHTEHEMLRYIKRLEAKDLSLVHSMISLGSCTMKLNATSEMFPVSWPEFGQLHPFAPADQTKGYAQLFADLEAWLTEITGFAAVSLQPNAGSQGEYAGLLVIRAYHESRGDDHRNICLIPTSAHGTNPATAAMCGYQVVPVACDASGNIDVADLQAKIATHAKNLAAVMITYPSTHGVFETSIKDICAQVHAAGGQVYMDGANMNAQVGLTSPGHIGADVCHLNLHKTFCIPHGGGGPGMGPIGVAAHLAPFLPRHVVVSPVHDKGRRHLGAVSAAPWGSASILVISWMYIRMMGPVGLTQATKIAILNANYVAARLEKYFPVLYRGATGLVAHECIVDLRGWKKHGIEAEDAAKRLMDYGYHAPTLSFPVPGTFMIEPTESETKVELDRFCEAMISIHAEMQAVVNGQSDKLDNPLKHAPHTAKVVTADTWTRSYSRQTAAFPSEFVRQSKFWPAVGRVDNVYGDRNLICSCAGMEAYAEVK